MYIFVYVRGSISINKYYFLKQNKPVLEKTDNVYVLQFDTITNIH